MQTLIVAIAKLENRYVREGVEHYKSIGVSNILLFDNNDLEGEKFEDIISDYINSGFVKVIDYRGRTICQLEAYQESGDNYSELYDWIGFFDLDEFLCFVNDNNITDYLQKAPEDTACIKINGLCYGDCGLVYYEAKPCRERFTKYLPLDLKTIYPFPQNYHIKSILNCHNAKDVKWNSNPHAPSFEGITYNNAFKKCDKSYYPFIPYNYDNAFIKHFTTKTISEGFTKMKRGYPNQSKEQSIINTGLDRFFQGNDVTQEKLNYINEQRRIT